MNKKTTKNTKKKKRKNTFNMYQAINKNKKTIVLIVCSLLVITLFVGVFAQFALAF